jgi:hypothetical protein
VSLILVLQQPDLSTGVVAVVNSLTDFILKYAVALAAVGALSMALIELWKKLFDSRTKFQARRWTQWMKKESAFEEKILPEDPAKSTSSTSPSREAAMAELIQLCTGVPDEDGAQTARDLFASDGQLSWRHAFVQPLAHAIFALDLARMMGTIQDAADVVLSSPQQNASLYLLMTSGANPDDILAWYTEGAPSMADIATIDPTPEDRRRIKEHADRFARLRQVVRRKLDGFQIYATDRWASRNQLMANSVGILLMLGILSWMKTYQNVKLSWGLVVVCSLFGGILSPVAKDLVTALKRVKDG